MARERTVLQMHVQDLDAALKRSESMRESAAGRCISGTRPPPPHSDVIQVIKASDATDDDRR
jgi:hypothetical protein